MGRSASSSKRKSSKPKSSKLSHEAQRKKKSKRNKSKKLLRRDDSSHSNDDSMSLSSVSPSSSEASYLSSAEDDYKSRKSRSRARSDAKSRKKKSKRKSSSPERSKDPPRTKKRKRLKKDVNSRLKKKSRKTKRKRDLSISSASSDSRSCSSCQDGSSRSIEEREPERRSGRSREKKRHKRDSYKFRNKTRKTRSRSPSCSSRSRYSHHSRSESPVLETIAAENKSRLRSVISVVEWRNEEDSHKSEKDLYKEEIIYDRDDYPSSRSNDSTDGLRKRDSAYFPHPESDNKMQGQSYSGEEVTLSNLGTKDPVEDAVGCSSQVITSENENVTGSSSKVAGSGDDDLELILRQKALENLRKFRGERQVNSMTTIQENKRDNNNDGLSASTADTVYEKSPRLNGSSTQCPTTDIEKSSNPTLKRRVTRAKVDGDVSGGGKTGKDPEASKQNDIHQLLSENSKKENNSTSYATNEQPGSGIASALRQGTLGTCSAVKQPTTAQSPSCPNLLGTKITGSDSASTLSPSTSNGNNDQDTGLGVVNISSSTGKKPTTSGAESTSLEHKSKGDESKDGSEFEKKTMSVMRGGEMVQVSYKVYIPKKPPALHRRQLKR